MQESGVWTLFSLNNDNFSALETVEKTTTLIHDLAYYNEQTQSTLFGFRNLYLKALASYIIITPKKIFLLFLNKN